MQRFSALVLASVVFGAAACSDGGSSASPEQAVKVEALGHTIAALDDRVWVLSDDRMVEFGADGEATGRSTVVSGLGGVVLEVHGGGLWLRGAYGTALFDATAAKISAHSDVAYESLAIAGGRMFGARDSDLYEIDPLTVEELGMVELPRDPIGSVYEVVWTPLVAVGEHVWVTVAFGATWRICDFDPANSTFGSQVRLVPDNAASAVLSGERIWVADRHGAAQGVVVATGESVDPAKPWPVGDTILDDSGSLFGAADGSLWLLDQPAQVVWQLDPVNGAAIASFHLKWRPSAMAVTTTDLWFVNGSDGRLTRLPRAALRPAQS